MIDLLQGTASQEKLTPGTVSAKRKVRMCQNASVFGLTHASLPSRHTLQFLFLRSETKLLSVFGLYFSRRSSGSFSRQMLEPLLKSPPEFPCSQGS